MLKKLVKYGNSNALILDKALLELLNISEETVIKIKTDGTSLILTPQNLAEEKVMPSIVPQEVFMKAANKAFAKSFKTEDDAKSYKAESMEISKRYLNAINTKDYKELAKRDIEMNALNKKYGFPEYDMSDATMAFTEVHEKYADVIKQTHELSNNPDYIHESVLLAEKYQNAQNSEEYIKEYTKLINKFIPECEQYQADLKKVSETFFKA